MRILGERRKPSWSTILAVLTALYAGATCAGCTYVAAPAPTSHPKSCVLLTRIAQTDTLIVGVYDPPCDEDADSVMYWRIEARPRCPLVAYFDADRRAAKVQAECPPLAPINPFPRG